MEALKQRWPQESPCHLRFSPHALREGNSRGDTGKSVHGLPRDHFERAPPRITVILRFFEEKSMHDAFGTLSSCPGCMHCPWLRRTATKQIYLTLHRTRSHSGAKQLSPPLCEFFLQVLMSTIRRQTRLRKEYLYRKSLEGKEKAAYERKQQIRNALQEGKPIPTELRGEEGNWRHEINLEDDITARPHNHIDDEYGLAGTRDPKVCVTTSRDPSSRLKQFMKEVKLIFPNAQAVNRGNTKVPELVEACRTHDFTDIVVVQETRGQPDGLLVCHLPLGPTAYFTISNVVMRHDIEDRAAVSEAYPHLILEGFVSTLGRRVADILKFTFPAPRPASQRVVTFANEDDHIVFRHHTFEKAPGTKGEVTLKEIGPRFDLTVFQVKLGTLEQTDAETEFVFRPYMNTAKKRRLL